MGLGTVIAVASGKGGTGKTFLTAGVSSCLAALDKTVLAIDGDMGLRNLDLSLGLADRIVMDISDVLEGRCALERAVVPHPEIHGLSLLAAPMHPSEGQAALPGLAPFLAEAKQKYDFLLIDCPAGLGASFQAAAACADRAIIIATVDVTSLRDAQQAVSMLGRLGCAQQHLVVNRVRSKVLRRMKSNLDDVMDTVSLPLLGVVPEDEKVTLAANLGKPLVLAGRGLAAVACLHIAQRLTGERVPLMRLRR